MTLRSRHRPARTRFLIPLLCGLAAVAAIRIPAQGELVVHKQGTTLYHRPGCPVVRDGEGLLALTRAQAEARGYKPHSQCEPATAASSPQDATSSSRSGEPPSAPVTVYVDGPKYYHRKDCPKLAANASRAKSLALEAAAKSHWPCPTCKAPIFKRNTEPAVPGTNRRRGG